MKKNKREVIPLQSDIQRVGDVVRQLRNESSLIFQNFGSIEDFIKQLVEVIRVLISLMAQDEVDKDSIKLIGMRIDKLTNKGKNQSPQPDIHDVSDGDVHVTRPLEPVIRMEEKCVSCTRALPQVLSALKIACLNYHASKVQFNQTEYD